LTKIWIIYNTKHGNSEKVCEDVKSKLSDKFKISIGNVTKITPEAIANDRPDLLIVGSRIIVGRPDKKVKKFVTQLGTILKEPIPKAATLYTHCLEWDQKVAKMSKIIKDSRVANDILSEFLEIKMEKMKGPEEPGQELKYQNFAERVAVFIEQ